MKKVVREVNTLLDIVWEMLVSRSGIISAFLPMSFTFSRTRSKMTMVALMEYPTIVSMQAMKVEPTETRITA